MIELKIFFLLVSFGASVIGSICGIGGGTIIKPVLDSFGFISVNSISFLSGCTVLSMAIVSLFKSRNGKEDEINYSVVIPLAMGAVLGGVLGKWTFDIIRIHMGNDNLVGLIQSCIMAVIIILTIIFLSYSKKNNGFKVVFKRSIFLSVIIGFLLGMLSAFLGIGGGPINIVILTVVFLMSTRIAAINNLFIIMFSQLSSLIYTIITKSVPEYDLIILVLMIAGGIGGGLVGSKLRDRLSNSTIEKIFSRLMIVILIINIGNVLKFYFA